MGPYVNPQYLPLKKKKTFIRICSNIHVMQRFMKIVIITRNVLFIVLELKVILFLVVIEKENISL